MPLWEVFAALGPHARVTTAVVPFAVSMCLRVVFGRNKFIGWLISVSTMWFLLNVLLAPYSPGMRDDLHSLGRMFR
jgi:hypothetical protein